MIFVTGFGPDRVRGCRVPHQSGRGYNRGGGRASSTSILEALDRAAATTARKTSYEHLDKNCEGDHNCYVSDLWKMRAHDPSLNVTKTLDGAFAAIVAAWNHRPGR